MKMYFTTASIILAVLCFIDPEETPKIAFDDDSLAKPLADKLKKAVGTKDGSKKVFLNFDDNEKDLLYQFQGCAQNIGNIFSQLD